MATRGQTDPMEDTDWYEDPRRRTAVVQALHDQLTPPAGWRVELIDGELVVSSVPTPAKAYTVELIRTALAGLLPPTLGAYENVEFDEPGGDLLVPDIGVWPRELMRYIGTRPHPRDCALAVDVVPSSLRRRTPDKSAAYARCGVPVYLVVERRRFTCVVFSEPEGDRYRRRHEVPFGKPVTLPLESPVTIDTSEF
jgi:hypothetical protein